MNLRLPCGAALLWLAACGGGGSDGGDATGGVSAGGASSGGATYGGATSGGATSGGSLASGGSSSGTGGSTSSGGAGMSGGASNGGSAGRGGGTTGGASGAATSGGAATGGSAGSSTGGAGGAAGAATGGSSGGGGKASTGGSATGGSATGGSATGGSAGASSGCADFKAPTQVGTFEATVLNGPSGMVASRAHAGVLYANLDAGGPATIFATTTAGKALGEYSLTGAKATDWEDLAVGRGPGTGSYIYVGDFGDNSSNRVEIQVLRVPEPEVSVSQAPVQMAITDFQTLRFTYPDNAHDAESLMVDPVTGDILIVTKITDGNSIVFRAAGTTPADTPTALEKLCNVQIGATGATGRAAQASAGDISPTGDRVAIRSYTAVFVWPRAASLAATFAATPHTLAWSTEPQGEGLTFSADGQSLYLTGEQARLIYQAAPVCP